MKLDLIVVSGNTPDSSPSVVIQSDDGIYLINVPDLSQRVLREKKIKFGRISGIISTSLHSNSISGFHGLVITSYNANGKNIPILAPNGMEAILQSFKGLHFQEDLNPLYVEAISDQFLTCNLIPLKESCLASIKLCDIPGKFQVQKARALGIPSGPLFKDLSAGKSITLADGKVVKPEDVVDPPIPGKRILIVDCRCFEDITMLPENCKDYDFVVHFTSIEFILNTDYLSKFSPEQTSICFPPNGKTTFTSVTKLYQSMMKVSPSLLAPLALYDWVSDLSLPPHMIPAEVGMQYTFAPIEKLGFIKFKAENVESCEQPKLPNIDSFHLTFMGTGSMYPSKYRCVSGILLHTKTGYIVLDAGEGFTSQLRRRYGIQNTQQILNNIKMVWISHNHGDHVFGLYQLLQERYNINSNSIPLICHEAILNHMNTIQSAIGKSLGFRYVSHEEPITIDDIVLESIPVNHCEGSLGCVITIDGKRIAYSGDRSIKDDFVQTVGQCDLLIHEATFGDDLNDTAADKCHSTISQAVETSKQLQAKNCILTHFSQRYPKMPTFDSSLSNVVFAFDYMSLRYEDIQEMCTICPKIFSMIAELEEKEDK